MSTSNTFLAELREVVYVTLIGSGGHVGRDWYEDTVKKTNGQDLEEIARGDLPYGTTALTSFIRLEGQVEIGGQTVHISSEDFGHSGTLYLGGTIQTREELASEDLSSHPLFLMDELWHCTARIKQGEHGQWKPFYPEKGDKVLTL